MALRVNLTGSINVTPKWFSNNITPPITTHGKKHVSLQKKMNKMHDGVCGANKWSSELIMKMSKLLRPDREVKSDMESTKNAHKTL